jgi:hypothetical protein
MAAALWLAAGSRAQAAPEWIFRRLTLPRGGVALDLGLGLGHAPIDADRSTTGLGMNLEIAFGVTHELEVGLRTGTRIGADGEATKADYYGRTFDTETYGTGGDALANPEIRMTWAVAQGSTVHLGLEGRVYLPIERGTRVGVMFAVPLRLRLGAVRIDTGVYVPLLFYDPTQDVVSFPFHIWLQASRTLWLGPLLGVQFVNDGRGSHTAYPLGFGLGSALTNGIDLRTWFLFPDINHDEAARTFGAGLALQIRFE